MAMLEYLEQDKEKFLAEMERAGTPDKAGKVLEGELEKLLYRYNERCESEAGREAAAYMIETARMSLPLVDTVGETLVWEMDEPPAEKEGKNPKALILPAAGLICAAASLVMAAWQPDGGVKFYGTPVTFILAAAAVILGFVGGRFFGGDGKPVKKGKTKTELKVDAGKIYRTLHTMVLSADRSLEEILSAERHKEKPGAVTESAGISQKELDLFANLLEARESGDGQFALDRIADVKYYLHRNGIETVDYREDTRQLFDIMPGSETGTIRPALVADGKLVKKGLASGGR